jgi:hypothetical protein
MNEGANGELAAVVQQLLWHMLVSMAAGSRTQKPSIGSELPSSPPPLLLLPHV